MADPFRVVRDFEAALCEYTGAPYCVTTTSCTMALLLAVRWALRNARYEVRYDQPGWEGHPFTIRPAVEIPKHTYVGVPMSILHAGGRPTFRDEDWKGWYDLRPLNVIDSARYLTSGLYNKTTINHLAVRVVCISFHWSKTLGIQQGGAILHNDPKADLWLRMARFDGREAGVAPKDQAAWPVIGWHAYMSPETAAAGLVRLANLPKNNAPLPWGPGTDSDYPDLSQIDIFK